MPFEARADSAAPVGEVIAAATTAFTAQCIETPRSQSISALPEPPSLGAFVRVGGVVFGGAVTETLPPDFDPFEAPTRPATDVPPAAIYGVVVQSETGALEAGRPLTAFGLTEAELQRDQPHLYELLATRFTAVPVAYCGDDGAIRHYLPPRPPRPHAQVFAATDEETRRLTERLDFLRTLLAGGSGGGSGAAFPADDLVSALLRNAAKSYGGGGAGEAFLLRAGRELASLLPTEYDRLRAIIARIAG